MKTLNGSALLKRGIKNTETKKKLGEKCVYCGCTNKLILTVDHKKPLARGGKDIISNKQVTCLPCNWTKGALTHGEYLKYYKALTVFKDLNKVKLQLGTFKMIFNDKMFPMKESDIKEKDPNDVNHAKSEGDGK